MSDGNGQSPGKGHSRSGWPLSWEKKSTVRTYFASDKHGAVAPIAAFGAATAQQEKRAVLAIPCLRENGEGGKQRLHFVGEHKVSPSGTKQRLQFLKGGVSILLPSKRGASERNVVGSNFIRNRPRGEIVDAQVYPRLPTRRKGDQGKETRQVLSWRCGRKGWKPPAPPTAR